MALAAKKRKAEQSDSSSSSAAAEADTPKLLPADARRLVEPLSKDQLLDILQDATCRHVDILDAVRVLADDDTTLRKLFVRGLSCDTTTDGLHAAFSAYGELREAVVITDRSTGKSKGFGFVTFRHVDGALLALKESSKLIDGCITVTKLSSTGPARGPGCNAEPLADVLQRKIYVVGIPEHMSPERLLQYFLQFGEIEEGPIGYGKLTMRLKRYAFFVYKTPEGANAATAVEEKSIDGYHLHCRLAAGAGLPVTSSGASTVSGYGANPGSSDRLGRLSSSSDLGAGSHYSLSSNLPSSLGVRSPGLLDARFDLPPSPRRGTCFGGGYSSSSPFAGIGRGGGPGADVYGGIGYSGGAHYQLDSSGITSGGDYGYSSSALRGQNQQPPRPPPDYGIPPQGSMYRRAMPPYY